MPAGNNVGSISIKVTPDTKLFRSELAAQLKAIEESLDNPEVPVKLVLDENGIGGKVKAATAGLDTTAKVKLDVDKNNITSLSGKLGKLFTKMPSVRLGSGINPAGYAVIALGLAATLAPVVGLVTTALLALPGLISAIAAPIAAITLGLKGIGTAAGVLKQPFEQLKSVMDTVNEKAFKPVFEKLAGIFPTLERALPKVSEGLAAMAQSVVDVIASNEGMAKIDSIISNIGTSLTNAAPGIGAFTNSFLTLADSLSKTLPSLGKWFSDAGGGFQEWVTKITTPTAGIGAGLAGGVTPLQTAFEGLGTTIEKILSLIGELGKKGLEFMNDPAAVEKMGHAFSSIADGIERAVGASSKFFELLDRIENSDVNRTLEDKGWFAQIKEVSNPKNLFGKDKMTTGITVEDLMSDDGLNMGSILGVLEKPFKAALDALGIGMASASAETGQQVGTGLGTGLGQGFQQVAATSLGPQVQTAVSGALTQLQTIPAQIQQAFAGVGAAVTGSMATVVGAVANAGSQIVAAFTASLSQIPPSATVAFNQVAAAAAAGMGNVVVAISTGASQALAAVTTMSANIISSMNSAAAGAEKAGAAIGQGMARGIKAGKAAAVAAARDLAAAVTAASQVKLGIKSPSTVFTKIGEQTAQGLQNGLEGGFVGVIERAKSLAQQLTDTVNGGLEGVDQKVLSEGIKKQLDELELQRKMLKVDKDAIPKEDKEGRKSVQGQLDQLQALKDQLALQKEQLGFSEKYGNSVGETNKNQDMLGESLTKMVDIGKNFAMSNVDQFMSDLGMSGSGAIPTLANEGLSFLSSTLSGLITNGFGGGTNINVNSVDEALAAKTTLDNKKALQYTGR